MKVVDTVRISPSLFGSRWLRAGTVLILLTGLGLGAASLSYAAIPTYTAEDGEIDQLDATIASCAFGARRDTIGGWNNWAGATGGEYTNLQASNNNYYRTADPGGGDNAAILFEFAVTDDPNSPLLIDLSVEVGRASPADAAYFCLWNYSTGQYDVLGSQGGSADQVFSTSVLSPPGQYVNPADGQMTLFLVNQDTSDRIRVDTLSVNISDGSGSFQVIDGEIDVPDNTIANGTFGARRDTINGWANWGSATSTELTNIQNSNNAYYRTADPWGGDNAAMLYEYYFADDPAAVTQIDVDVEIAQGALTDAVYFYLWDYTAGQYDVMGSVTSTSDTVFSHSALVNPGRYLDGNGQLTLFIVNQDTSDWIRVDTLSVSVTAAPPAPHFAIGHDGGGDICTIEQVTITKHDASHVVDTGYTGTVTLSTSTSHGDWSLISGAGSVTNLGNGGATYTFAAADNGQVVLGLKDTFAESVNIDVTDGVDTEDATEDPDLVFVTLTSSGDYRDLFSSVSYSRNDGTLNWTGNWQESDDDGNPGTGHILINSGSGELSLDDLNDNTAHEVRIEREADLAGAQSATLSFNFRTTNSVDGDDTAYIEVSNNGGGTWSILETIAGSHTAPQARSYDISAYAAPTSRIRFRIKDDRAGGGGVCCYGGANEVFLIDDVRIQAVFPAVCPGADHFAISHDGAGINCQAEPVTISAHDATHTTDTSYTGTVTLSTSTGHGDWSVISGAPPNLGNAGNGNATYVFDGSEGGTIVLGLKDTFVETTNIHLADGSSTEDASEDPDLVFSQAGFNFLADTLKNAIGTQISGKSSAVAPGLQTLELEAIRTSDETGACEAALVGNLAVEMAFECEDPTTCTATQASISGTDIAGNNNGSVASYTGVTLDFGDATDTTAGFTLIYPDSGQIQLHARYNIPLEDGAPSGNYMLGASNSFVVRPFGFLVTVPGNQGATDDNGNMFIRAGETMGDSFQATVTAVQWQAADDTDADGVPDGFGDTNPGDNATLTDNGITANFGNETAGNRAGINLSRVHLHPLPADGGTEGLPLSGDTGPLSANNGTLTSGALRYSEVGVIEADAATSNYFGSLSMRGGSRAVGRIYPDHFSVTGVPTLTPRRDIGGCGDNFTYMDENFDLDFALQAQNADGNPTQNYETAGGYDYAYLDIDRDPPLASGELSYGAIDDPDGTATQLTARLFQVAVGGSFSNGVAAVSGTLRILRDPGVDGPFQDLRIGVNPADKDGVGLVAASLDLDPGETGFDTHAELAIGDVRFGRLVVVNAAGSELLTLSVPLRAQYYNGSGFVTTTGDNCTSLVLADLSLSNDVEAGETDGNIQIQAGVVTQAAIANTPFSAGDGGLSFCPPGNPACTSATGNTGYADIEATAPSYLLYDWDGVGGHDDNPTGRATFGIFQGSPYLIHMREPWN